MPVELVAGTVAHADDELVAAGGQLEIAMDARGAVAGDARRRHLGLEHPLAVDLELDDDGRPLARAYLGAAHVGRHPGQLLLRRRPAGGAAVRAMAEGQGDDAEALGNAAMARPVGQGGDPGEDDRQHREADRHPKRVAHGCASMVLSPPGLASSGPAAGLRLAEGSRPAAKAAFSAS